jgi:ribosomal-protein-alanine N-acetyltransferase
MNANVASYSKPLALQWRVMQQQDLAQVLTIERASYDYPWTQKIFEDCLAGDYQCWVVDHEAAPKAYLIWSSVLDEAHLLNICVAAELRRYGLGQKLLTELCHQAAARGVLNLFLEVRHSNRAAMTLYQQNGFCEVGIRRRYYPTVKGHEDALIMAKMLTGTG